MAEVQFSLYQAKTEDLTLNLSSGIQYTYSSNNGMSDKLMRGEPTCWKLPKDWLLATMLKHGGKQFSKCSGSHILAILIRFTPSQEKRRFQFTPVCSTYGGIPEGTDGNTSSVQGPTSTTYTMGTTKMNCKMIVVEVF